MPSGHPGKKGTFSRRVAPFAPLAVAVAMHTAQRAGVHPVAAHGAFAPLCTLPFAGARNAAIDDRCGINGGSKDAAKQAESQAKNNFCATAQSPRAVTYEDLTGLQSQSGHTPRRIPDRSVVKSLGEGQLVSYIAFIKEAHYSDVAGGENVNCDIPGNPTNDVHIVLLQNPGDDECKSTTAEMSPHYRPANWTPAALNALKEYPVRIQGQLFFDGSHTPCTTHSKPTPKRASLWEIHPVYSIDVCGKKTLAECQGSGDAWTPLSQYLSSQKK